MASPSVAPFRAIGQLVSRTTTQQRAWALTGLVIACAALLSSVVWGWPQVASEQTLPVWVLAPAFYVGEVTVVHIRFKRNTQSFSMSEIALVFGLFFVAPALVLVAQFVGNLAALTFNRRQPILKLVFNLAQFTLVTAASIALFHVLVGGADPHGPVGWLSAVAAVAAGNVLANALVHLVIRVTGGRLRSREILEVLALSTAGAAVNSSLALLAVTLFEMRPAAAWLALIPVAVLYGAYHSYVGQKQERSRLESLYEITKLLHASPQLENAMAAAAVNTQQMLEAERVDILLFNQEDRDWIYQTTAEATGTTRVMTPVGFVSGNRLIEWLGTLDSAQALTEAPPLPNATAPGEDVIAAPLTSESGGIGAVIVADPLADVSGFGPADIKLLDAVAGKISISLRNGRLEDSLNELTLLKERLEDQVRGKDQFIATVSHELRTPLTTVLGLSHELGERRSQFSDAELDEIVSLIANESTELSHLIEDLLVGARADVSTLSLHPQIVDLATELGVVVQGHAHQTGSEEVDVAHLADTEKVWADPLRLRQIVRNLLTNATRYGGGRIWIEITERNEQTVITVWDDGSGVPKHRESLIFEAYESGHDGAVRAEPGSVGLGLAVSRRLAELMDGSLSYLRRDGCTGFELALPARPDRT
ncbi:MAG: HAMP domain-containing sensor histidine kinase [Acidimicrobiia bacterium]|nr:HAMP domain-containing sensor histidine kinase [Acidimicrobiia bacterium]